MKPTKRLENKIEKCPKVWLIVQLEHWYIKECYWTGKWTKDDKPQPIVWHYNKDFEKRNHWTDFWHTCRTRFVLFCVGD